jgi:S-adenosyl-L-methionine hydrolase (adenosine-forming)
MTSVPVVTFLSDYGACDEFVGVCHGVIARRCPSARVIDLGHRIARQDVRAGALALRAALPFAPEGVHLAVVDPGVGGPRRAVALRTREGERVLVGPDNGLLSPAAERFGGVAEAVDVGDSPECLRPISATFHGRDVFAPVAAALADGASLDAVGAPIAPGSLATLALPRARVDGAALVAHVLTTDVYGNVALDATAADAAAAGLEPGGAAALRHAGGSTLAAVGRTFGDAAHGELVVYVDARGALAIAVNGGSAAERLALAIDDELRLEAR